MSPRETRPQSAPMSDDELRRHLFTLIGKKHPAVDELIEIRRWYPTCHKEHQENVKLEDTYRDDVFRLERAVRDFKLVLEGVARSPIPIRVTVPGTVMLASMDGLTAVSGLHSQLKEVCKDWQKPMGRPPEEAVHRYEVAVAYCLHRNGIRLRQSQNGKLARVLEEMLVAAGLEPPSEWTYRLKAVLRDTRMLVSGEAHSERRRRMKSTLRLR